MSSTETERRRHRRPKLLQPRLYDPFDDEEGDTTVSTQVEAIDEKTPDNETTLQEFQALTLANRIKNFRQYTDPHTGDWTVNFLIAPESQVIFQKGMNKPTEVTVQPKPTKSPLELKTYSGEIAQKISEIWYDLHPAPNE